VVAPLLVAGSIGCRSEPRTWQVEMPVVRFLEQALPAAPGVLHGADLEIDRDRRRTLASVETKPATGRVVAEAGARWLRLDQVPTPMQAAGTVVVERKARLLGRTITTSTPAKIGPSGELSVRLDDQEEPRNGVVLRSGAPPEAYDVLTAPFMVVAGSVLTFAVGVDAPATAATGVVLPRVEVVDASDTQQVWRIARTVADRAWRDQRVRLDRWVGRTIRLRFGGRTGVGTTAGTTAVFADPIVLAPRIVAAPALNVLLISMDTLRAKSVGAYGCAYPTTPAIDALAAEGALFENAFSPAAYTLPGHASMLTGLWMHTHGLVTPKFVLGFAQRGLAEALRQAGWTTGGFTSASAWLDPDTGFAGFDRFVGQDAPFYPPTTAEPYLSFTHGLEWMESRGGRPFFAFLHNFQVHRPYLPPQPYSDLFRPEPFGADPDRQQLAYEREVRYADDQVRALLDGVEWSGLRDRTLVILTADHGEAFFEHGWIEHTYDVHDEIARIPLIMRLPGAIPAGRRITEPVSLVDIVPTVLDLLGLPPLPVDGMSLLPLMTGAADRLPRDAVFTEAESGPQVGWTDLGAVHTRSYSCVRNARTGTTECWDGRVDPWQLGPPLPDGTTSSGLAAARAALAQLSARPAVGTLDDASLPPERREQLRALGYIQ
jgi:arylsulfatase A-like enzyme